VFVNSPHGTAIKSTSTKNCSPARTCCRTRSFGSNRRSFSFDLPGSGCCTVTRPLLCPLSPDSFGDCVPNPELASAPAMEQKERRLLFRHNGRYVWRTDNICPSLSLRLSLQWVKREGGNLSAQRKVSMLRSNEQ